MKKPEHFFQSESGDLFDCRNPNWSQAAPLRRDYKKQFSEIETVAQFKATLRAGEFAFPGAYQLYFGTSDGAAICFDCGKKEFRNIADSIRNRHNDGWRVAACLVADWQEETTTCDHCGKAIYEVED